MFRMDYHANPVRPFLLLVAAAIICQAATSNSADRRTRSNLVVDRSIFNDPPANMTGACQRCPPGGFANTTAKSPCVLEDTSDVCKGVTGGCPYAPPDYPSPWSPGGKPTYCSQCEKDKFSASIGSTACSYCDFGFFPNSTLTGCTICDPGNTTSTDNRNCHPCSPGEYTPGKDSRQCTRCDDGKQPNYNGGGCDVCRMGLYSDANTKGLCEFCPIGKEPTETHAQCTGCYPGFVSNNDTSRVCAQCPNPAHIASDDHTTCSACELGKTPDANRTACTICEKGYYWDPVYNYCPYKCPAGRFCQQGYVPGEPAPNNSFCAICQECGYGKYSKISGSYSCTQCPKGTFAFLRGSNFCTECSPGEYQDRYGQKTCKECSEGTYQESTGMSFCNQCPVESYCPKGASKPLRCGSLYKAEGYGCKPTTQLIGIITGSVVAGVAILAIIGYRRFRQFSAQQAEERQRLVATKAKQEPVYTGL